MTESAKADGKADAKARPQTYICPPEAAKLLVEYAKEVRAGNELEAKEGEDVMPELARQQEEREEALARQLNALCRGDSTAVWLAGCRADGHKDSGALWVDAATGKATAESPLWRLDQAARACKGHVVHEFATGRTWALPLAVGDSLASITDRIRAQLAADVPADGRGVFHHAKRGRAMYTSAAVADTTLSWHVHPCWGIVHGWQSGAEYFEIHGERVARSAAEAMSLATWLTKNNQAALAKVAQSEPILIMCSAQATARPRKRKNPVSSSSSSSSASSAPSSQPSVKKRCDKV